MHELAGQGFEIRAEFHEPRQARHQSPRHRSRLQRAVHVAKDVNLLRLEEMLQHVFGEHARGPARERFGPKVQKIPGDHAIVVRNEVQIDEPVEDALAAAEMEPKLSGERRHRIGAPQEMRREAGVLPGKLRQRERGRL